MSVAREPVARPTAGSRLPAYRTLLLVAAAIAVVAILARPAGQPAPSTQASRSPEKSAAIPLAARLAVSRALGADQRTYWVGRGLVASNPAQSLTARFGREGIQVHSAAGEVGLSLVGVGRGTQLRPLPATRPFARENRVSFRPAGLTEWYANGPLGVEQGLTLAKPPAGTTGTPVTFALALSGALHPRLVAGDTLLLGSHRKAGQLQYTGLSAYDSRGHVLPAWLELQGGRLLISVDDAGAVYPVSVDPVIATLSPSDTGGALGSALAAAGSTLVAGAPGAADGDGAAYVFVEPPSGWQNATQTAELTANDGDGGDGLGTAVAITQPSTGPATIVAGAPGHNDEQGAAYVFVQPGGGWSSMPAETQTAELSASDGQSGDALGQSVAVGSTPAGIATVAAGAPYAQIASNDSQGAAYVFVEPPGGTWAATPNETEKLVSSGGAAGDSFGSSIAIPDSGATVAAAAPFADGDEGAVYVFAEPMGGWSSMATPSEVTLTASTPQAGDELGTSLTASGSAIVAGIAANQPASDGGLYVFVEPAGGWMSGPQTAELTASDSDSYSLGASAALTVEPSCTGVLGLAGTRLYDYVEPTTGWASTADTYSLAINDGYDQASGYSLSALAASSTDGFAGDAGASGEAGVVSVFSLTNCQATSTTTATSSTTAAPTSTSSTTSSTSSSASSTTATRTTTTTVPTRSASTQLPPESAAAQLVLTCTKAKLTLLDVLEKSGRVSITGAAIASLIGDPVRVIFNDKKVVGTTVIGPSGFFAVTAPLPPAKVRNTNSARYLAEVGTIESLNLKLTRRLVLQPPTVSGDMVDLSGQVTTPLARPLSPVAIQEQTSCKTAITLKRFKPQSNGHFSIAVTAPAGESAAIFRLSSKVPEKAGSRTLFPTFSLPEVAALG